MPDYFSTALTRIRDLPDSQVSRHELGGHVRVAKFDIAPGANVVDGDRLFLTLLPAKARVVGGVFEVTNAFGSATSNGKIRTDTTDLAFSGANALNLATAGQWVIDRVARGLDYEGKRPSAAQEWERVYVEVQAIASAVTTGRIRGVILYVA